MNIIKILVKNEMTIQISDDYYTNNTSNIRNFLKSQINIDNTCSRENTYKGIFIETLKKTLQYPRNFYATYTYN